MKSMLQSSLMKYSINFSKRHFSLLTWHQKKIKNTCLFIKNECNHYNWQWSFQYYMFSTEYFLKPNAWLYDMCSDLCPLCMWGVDDVSQDDSLKAEVCGRASTEWATTQSQIRTQWKVKVQTYFTSLKLSKAERIMSCPPRTRHTAASNSRTRALVLWNHRKDKFYCRGWLITRVCFHQLMCLPGISAVEAECDLIHTSWMTHYQVEPRLEVWK